MRFYRRNIVFFMYIYIYYILNEKQRFLETIEIHYRLINKNPVFEELITNFKFLIFKIKFLDSIIKRGK